MDKEHVVGMDVAGNGIHFQVQSRQGELLVEGKAGRSMDGFNAFNRACSKAGLRWERTLVVIEATGRLHLPWCERLFEEGALVYALNPLLTKRLYSSKNAIRDNKDDRLDAHSLAEIGRLHGEDLERFSYRPQSSRLELQSLVGARVAVRRQCTNLLKSAGDLLDLIFPEAKKVGMNLTHAGLRRLLLRKTTPAEIAEVGEKELTSIVGKKGADLLKAARNSFTPEKVSCACKPALQAFVETIEDLFRQIENLEQSIGQCLRSLRCQKDGRTEKLIRSIPGFGKKTAATVAAFLPEDFDQWGTKKKITAKLQAYFGCDPRRRESGSFKGKVKLSKRGIEIARTALYQASFCSINHDPEVRAYYEKKKAEGDHHKKALFDLVRKNLRRIVAVLIDQKEFEHHYEKTA